MSCIVADMSELLTLVIMSCRVPSTLSFCLSSCTRFSLELGPRSSLMFLRRYCMKKA